ncbi:MAG TPA: CAP domain-containing protein [Candidatus Saccharimonadales bacterium]|nr:CAP domain-containing protein [Candidatus Saccharimonadales bacterium]
MKQRRRKKSNFKRWGVSAAKAVIVLLAFYGFFSLVDDVYGRDYTDLPPVKRTAEEKPPSAKDWLKAINKQRKKHGVAPLKLDKRLNASATKKAKELQREGKGSDPHVNSKGIDGYTYAQKSTGCHNVSENISVYFADLNDAVKGWMESPPHRAAILDPKYELTGFGVTKTYAVQHFADC